MAVELYVDLESLLDNRFGAICYSNPQVADAILEDDRVKKLYQERITDHFPDIFDDFDQEAYLKLRKAKDKEHFVDGCRTKMPGFISELLRDLEHGSATPPSRKKSTINVNVAGFKFTEEELKLTRGLVWKLFGGVYNIKVVDIPFKELNPVRLRNLYDYVIMYDYDAWLGEYFQRVKEEGMPQVTLIAPMVSPKSMKEFTQLSRTRPDGPFHASEVIMSDCFQLRYIESKFFSI